MGAGPVPLNPLGKAQAERLALCLKSRQITAVYSSPVARTLETAEILASMLEIPVSVEKGLTEIGVGHWEGRFWKDIEDEIARQNFYASPEEARPPGGETFGETQRRAVAAVERAVSQAATGHLLFVSHADVIRAILAHYLGFDLREIRRIRIDHASLTALNVDGAFSDLLLLNYTPDLRSLL